jgi:hypothetical protein
VASSSTRDNASDISTSSFFTPEETYLPHLFSPNPTGKWLCPIGKLDFRNGVKAGITAYPGKDFEFQPELYTVDGLLIVTCVRGTSGGHDHEDCFAETMLVSGKDRADAARSGFA